MVEELVTHGVVEPHGGKVVVVALFHLCGEELPTMVVTQMQKHIDC